MSIEEHLEELRQLERTYKNKKKTAMYNDNLYSYDEFDGKLAEVQEEIKELLSSQPKTNTNENV